MTRILARHLPILTWGRTYGRETFVSDMIAAVIVTIMLIPQSLAYALLAGLPPEAGIYASIVPILIYSVLGTSRSLAVGPVAVVSLMTAAAIGDVAQQGTAGYAAAALTLAALSGGILLILGLFRLGFLANFLSHPVISGFINATGILIALGQFRHLLGIDASGHTLPHLVQGLWQQLGNTHWITLLIGAGATGFLFWARSGLKPLLLGVGLAPRAAEIMTRAGPVAAVIVTTAVTALFGLDKAGVKIVGAVPQALPPFTIPDSSTDLVTALLVPALMISIIGFVESISVAQTLAARKRQRIDPDQELIGLGAANLGAAFTGGYPVTGGFARSVVNFDAGAETPAAGAFTAIGLAIAAVALTPLIHFLPKATLAATIIVAVLSLVDLSVLKRAWIFSRADFAAVLSTGLVTLGFGVEAGVSAGVALSIALHLYKTSRPHVAEVGRVPGTEHFRNIRRHDVVTDPALLTLRVDESLYFANARFLEDYIANRVSEDSGLKDVILQFTAVNEVDMSALESLEAINERLRAMGIGLHLSEVKGPVMDRLRRSHFLEDMSGDVFLTQFEAWSHLTSPQAQPTG
ncbi:sodium-independent anion transporter [Roseovarius sp. TE539]|uniref:SulP family inorganic anion transporter n=1 Tax=Roseovarius sp. TE539 TaxID=2249812 RepID=UPI000DDEE116|nr:sulfate permease [Roseovarius sp. TE539]RBI70345.1 sodium-independent anion transporter [Roseovarius sp. TE539]